MKAKFLILSACIIFASCGENKEEKKETPKEEETTENTKEEVSYEVNEIDVTSEWVVSITTKQTTVPEIANVLGKSYGDIFTFLSEAKIEMGIPRAYSHNWLGLDKPFDLEAAIPVTDSTLKVKSPMELRKTYSGKALKVVYFGAYENMHNAYTAIEKYMEENSLTPNGSPWEVYIGDPGVEKDMSKVQTDIYMPVK